MMVPAYEHPRLAHYLETDNSIGSNALDKTASEMLEKNAEYAEDLLDHHSPDLPTFHVVHEADQDENETEIAPSHHARHPHHVPSHKNDVLSSSSSESSIRESSSTSSTSEDETSEEDDLERNELSLIKPYNPSHTSEWQIDRSYIPEDSDSPFESSDSDEQVNYFVPRADDELVLTPQKRKRRHRERFEYDMDPVHSARAQMPPAPPQPRKEIDGPLHKKHHTSYPTTMPDEATVAREIEQLRSMAEDYVPHYSDSEPEEPEGKP